MAALNDEVVRLRELFRARGDMSWLSSPQLAGQLAGRRPDSGQGAQDTREQFQRLLAENEITCSMRRASNVWGSCAMESFFSSLKTERTTCKLDRSRDQDRADVFDDIERFYNVWPQ